MRFKFPHFEDTFIEVDESQEAAYLAAGWLPVEEAESTARKSTKA